jgi:hypothetical protein
MPVDKAIQDGYTKRYLPEKAWASLSKKEREETDRKKRAGSKEGIEKENRVGNAVSGLDERNRDLGFGGGGRIADQISSDHGQQKGCGGRFSRARHELRGLSHEADTRFGHRGQIRQSWGNVRELRTSAFLAGELI